MYKQRDSEALHTDDLALTALRQLFIKLLKEHNQVICVAFCFRLFFFSPYSAFAGERDETEYTPMNKSEAKKGVKTVGPGQRAEASCWPSSWAEKN